MLVSFVGRLGYLLKSCASSGESSSMLKGWALRLLGLLLSLVSCWGGLGGSCAGWASTGGWFSLWGRKHATEQLEVG